MSVCFQRRVSLTILCNLNANQPSQLSDSKGSLAYSDFQTVPEENVGVADQIWTENTNTATFNTMIELSESEAEAEVEAN